MERINNQLHHLESRLKESTMPSMDEVQPTWVIAIGHYPVFSAGSHGDTQELSVNLLPLLEKYHVHAYFSGHDHISEHLL